MASVGTNRRNCYLLISGAVFGNNPEGSSGITYQVSPVDDNIFGNYLGLYNYTYCIYRVAQKKYSSLIKSSRKTRTVITAE